MSEVSAPSAAPTTTPSAAPTTGQVKESSPQLNEANGSSDAAAVTPEMKRKFKLKVDGEEVEEEIDFNDEAGMVQRLQLAKAAKKRMTEAVSARKQAMDIVKAFEKDPESMLERLGDKGREIAEKYLMKHIQETMLTPEEKKQREIEKKLKEYEEKEERENKLRETTAQERKEYEYAQAFQNTIVSALEKSGLPKSPELVKRMASIMQKNLDFGLELTPDDLVEEVKSELTQMFQAITKDSDGEKLLNILGKDAANKIRKYDLKSLQEKQAQVFQGGGKKPSQSKPEPKSAKGYTTIDEWKEQISKRVKENP